MALLSGFSLRRFLAVFVFQAILIGAAFALVSDQIQITLAIGVVFAMLLVSSAIVAAMYAHKPSEEQVMRVETLEEEVGLDLSEHGERAYS